MWWRVARSALGRLGARAVSSVCAHAPPPPPLQSSQQQRVLGAVSSGGRSLSLSLSLVPSRVSVALGAVLRRGVSSSAAACAAVPRATGGSAAGGARTNTAVAAAASSKKRGALMVVSAALAAGLGVAGWKLYEMAGEEDVPLAQLPHRIFVKARDGVVEMVRRLQEPARETLLPPPLPQEIGPRMTLVLDLEGTLLHSEWDRDSSWRYKKRPGVADFLEYLSQFYEIVLFSEQTGLVVTPLMDKLDTKGYVMYRLFRDATLYKDGKYVKDLSRLGRPLQQVVLIDNDPAAYQLQPENALRVSSFVGAEDDQELTKLIPFLRYIATEVPDARDAIREYASAPGFPDAFNEWYAKREEKKKRLERQLGSSVSPFGGMMPSPPSAGAVPPSALSPLPPAGGMMPFGAGALGGGMAQRAAAPKPKRTVWNWVHDKVQERRLESVGQEMQLVQELQQRYGPDAMSPERFSALGDVLKQQDTPPTPTEAPQADGASATHA